MTLVRETFRRPQGEPTEVKWSLVGDRGPITGYIPAAAAGADVTYVGAVVVTIPDGDDVAVTVDLVPSSAIVPAGTRWVRTGHGLDPLHVIVPVVGAGVVVDAWDIVSDPPGAIVSPDDAALLGDRVALVESLLSAGLQTGGLPSESSTVLVSGGAP